MTLLKTQLECLHKIIDSIEVYFMDIKLFVDKIDMLVSDIPIFVWVKFI